MKLAPAAKVGLFALTLSGASYAGREADETPEFAPAAPLTLGSSATLGASDASADAEAFAAAARSTPDGSAWSLFLAPAGAAAAVVAWMTARRKRRTPKAPEGIATRAQADGFWVTVPSLAQGARVRYTCIVDGAEITDIVPVTPDRETFIPTSGRPTAIRVAPTFATTSGGYRSAQPILPDDDESA